MNESFLKMVFSKFFDQTGKYELICYVKRTIQTWIEFWIEFWKLVEAESDWSWQKSTEELNWNSDSAPIENVSDLGNANRDRFPKISTLKKIENIFAAKFYGFFNSIKFFRCTSVNSITMV